MKTVDLCIKTLNEIDVRGKENLDKLLGVIQTLERLNNVLDKSVVIKEENKNASENEPG